MISTIIPLPRLIQQLLSTYNFLNLPTSDKDILTTVERKEALELLKGLVHPSTIQVLYRIVTTQTSKASQSRHKEYWDGEFLFIARDYFDKKYGSVIRKIISEELICLEQLGVLEIFKHKKGTNCRGYKVIWDKLLPAFLSPVTINTPKIFMAVGINRKEMKPTDIAKLTEKNILGVLNLGTVCNYFSQSLPVVNSYKMDWLLVELNIVLSVWINKTSYDPKTNLVGYKQSFYTSLIGGRTYSQSRDQLISRELKAAWFDIPNVYNYDIVGCHLSIFNAINPTLFVDSWLNNCQFKQQLADEIGITKDILKQSVLAILYGAPLTANIKCKVFELFLNYFLIFDTAREKLELFKDRIKELKSAVNEWHKSIKDNPKLYQKNKLGLKITDTCPKTLASHFLIGIEQEAINWVSSLANQKKYGYRVISDQFDGIATIGEIPDDLLSLFSDKFNLSLAVKPFN
jgi:hypothetical protein